MSLRFAFPALAAVGMGVAVAVLRVAPGETPDPLPSSAIDLLGEAWHIEPAVVPVPLEPRVAIVSPAPLPSVAYVRGIESGALPDSVEGRSDLSRTGADLPRPLPRPAAAARATALHDQGTPPAARPLRRPALVVSAPSGPGARPGASAEGEVTASSRSPAVTLWALRRAEDGRIVAHLPLEEALAILQAQTRHP
jgi:hypothetical protein